VLSILSALMSGVLVVDSVGNLHDHLLAAEEGVANELARSQRDWLLTVRHLEGLRVIEPEVCLRWIIETECRKGVGR
jgi:hypothetical protein